MPVFLAFASFFLRSITLFSVFNAWSYIFLLTDTDLILLDMYPSNISSNSSSNFSFFFLAIAIAACCAGDTASFLGTQLGTSLPPFFFMPRFSCVSQHGSSSVIIFVFLYDSDPSFFLSIGDSTSSFLELPRTLAARSASALPHVPDDLVTNEFTRAKPHCCGVVPGLCPVLHAATPLL